MVLDARARTEVSRLTASVLAVKPLVEGGATPIRVVRPAGVPEELWPRLDRLLGRVARHAGVTGLVPAGDVALADLQVFERVVSDRLALAGLADACLALPDDLPPEVDEVVVAAVADGFDAFFGKDIITAADGVPLNVFAAGPDREAVVLIPACGMPAALTESWMRHMAGDRRLLAWESRGMFGAGGRHEGHAVDVAAQAADLFAVMDHYGVATAHVVGLCGGAVIALAAAAGQPDRISSLSLWHGAYTIGTDGPRTRHQHDLIELMALAAHSRTAARSVQTAFCHLTLTSTPAELAHLVLYPFASPDLFFRYCRLNGRLATTDVEPYLPRVRQPVLVVTSEDDHTAHPQGSRRVAEGLPNARLRIEPHGDHASLFRANAALMQVAVDFMDEVPARPGGPGRDVLVSRDSTVIPALDSVGERP
jgi:3-oxoadipate enol-lactonase